MSLIMPSKKCIFHLFLLWRPEVPEVALECSLLRFSSLSVWCEGRLPNERRGCHGLLPFLDDRKEEAMSRWWRGVE